jgi:hypothetical protein
MLSLLQTRKLNKVTQLELFPHISRVYENRVLRIIFGPKGRTGGRL